MAPYLFKLIKYLFPIYTHYIYKTSDYDSFKCHQCLQEESCMSLFFPLRLISNDYTYYLCKELIYCFHFKALSIGKCKFTESRICKSRDSVDGRDDIDIILMKDLNHWYLPGLVWHNAASRSLSFCWFKMLSLKYQCYKY